MSIPSTASMHAQLPAGQPDRPQRRRLPAPFEDRQRQRVGDADQRDHHGDREQADHDREERVDHPLVAGALGAGAAHLRAGCRAVPPGRPAARAPGRRPGRRPTQSIETGACGASCSRVAGGDEAVEPAEVAGHRLEVDGRPAGRRSRTRPSRWRSAVTGIVSPVASVGPAASGAAGCRRSARPPCAGRAARRRRAVGGRAATVIHVVVRPATGRRAASRAPCRRR